MQRSQEHTVSFEASINVAYEEIFDIQAQTIKYVNTEEKIIVPNLNIAPIVHNHICYQDGNQLVKVTEVHVADKIVRITDVYVFQSEDPKVQNKVIGTPIFQRRGYYSIPGKKTKTDTRNLVKNLVNLYLKWLDHKKRGLPLQSPQKSRQLIQGEEPVQQQQKHMEVQVKLQQNPPSVELNDYKEVFKKVKAAILKVKKYNKNLLAELSKNPLICHYFIIMTQANGEHMIKISNIKDKQTHLKSLLYYCQRFKVALSQLGFSPMERLSSP